MALLWSKKSKAEKNYGEEVQKAKAAAPKPVNKLGATKAMSKAKAPSVPTKAVALPKGSFSEVSDAILRPHVTEKSGLLSQSGVYTFQISSGATKSTVAKAVKTLYKVTPVKIAIVNLPSKDVFVKGRHGTVPGVRKALVTVKKGDKIDFV